MSVQSAILIAPPIYSGQAWTQVQIFEQQTANLVLIDTQAIALDSTPATGDEYRVTTTLATLDSADYTYRFVTAAGATSPPIGPVRLPSSSSAGGVISGGAFYGTVAALRTEVGVDATVLTDVAAERLLRDASDHVDYLLGARYVDPVTGRKVVLADVEVWQFTRLARATVLLAARLWAQPALLSEVQYQSVSGPDFSFTGRQGSVLGAQFLATLTDTGLRRLTSRATGGRGFNPQDEFATNRDYRTDRYR